jgi:hypothetical protein
MQVQFTPEEAAKIKAAREAKASKAAARNDAAGEAYKKALESVDYDEDRLIVHSMPEKFGGAIIHRLPTPEAWVMVSKRITKALISDGKKDSSDMAITNLVELPALLVHPTLGELQQWRQELPDLYAEIHNTMDARCSHGQASGK